MLVKESSNRDTYSIIKGMTIEKQNVLRWSYLYLYKRPVICEKSSGVRKQILYFVNGYIIRQRLACP